MRRILLIDDEELILEFLTELLEAKGYEVVSTSEGMKAIELLDADCPNFDIVVSDLTMPVVSGLDILKKVHEKCPTTPFIIITGFPNFDTVTEAFSLGAYSYVTKPIDAAYFFHLLDRAYEKKQLEEENLRYKNYLEEQVKERTIQLTDSLAKLEKTLGELELFQHCFKQSNDAKVILDKSRKIYAVNKAFEKNTGFREEEVVGKTMSVLRSDYFDSAFYQAIWKMAEENGSWVGDVVNRRKNGTVYQTRFSLSAIRDTGNTNKFFLGTFMDIEF